MATTSNISASSSISKVRSADGTEIAVESSGRGPAIILIGGAWNDRTSVAGVAQTLAPTFTTVVYDRRSRGDSGDVSGHYEVGREIEDLAAVIDHVGGTAAAFGHSSGAVLAMEGALRGLPITRLALYEPPYIPAGSRPRPGQDVADRLVALIEANRRDEAVVLYQSEVIGLPPEYTEAMRAGDGWTWLTGLAHSLPYDYALLGPDLSVPTQRLADLRVPTLVVAGSNTFEWLQTAARDLADAIPGARHVTLEGEDHAVLQRPEALRSLLTTFFAS
jgi:pimeloyl-ACP methyl ester carboxylesterase